MRMLAGRYELIEKVGAGGMSVVWRAHDTRLGRDVAVKLLHPFVAAEASQRRRFAREARTLAALSSDHIVRVHDYVEAGDDAFLVMEFVDGRNLASATFHRLPVPWNEAAAFAHERELAEDATAARAAGIDWYSFTVAFKGVLLEGLEVAFIVVTFGSTQGRVGLAAAAAVAAVVLVVAAGFVVRGPLERVPENALKFAVGIMLTSFGIFWAGEGAGVDWPGGDVAIAGIVGYLALVSVALVRALRRRRAALEPVAAAVRA